MNWRTGVYQIAYCDSKFWDEKQPLKTQLERTFRWYVLECPGICIPDLEIARARARKQIKQRFGARAQVVIISEAKDQYQTRTADYVTGISTLCSAKAFECKVPDVIFEKRAKAPVFYSNP